MAISEQFNRNAGFISAGTQQLLADATIAIAGVGGVGGKVATELVRLGVTKLRLADPDIFTITNLNRQEGSYTSTLNQSKAHVIAKMCRDINPNLDLTIYDQGITDHNLEDFVAGANFVIEATDFMLPHLGVSLARSARQHNIPLLMGIEIGYGATLTWFKPTGLTYEQYFGLSNNVSLHDLQSGRIKIDFRRWLPHVPSYGDLKVLKQVASGNSNAPAIAPAVSICAAIMSTQIVALLSGNNAIPPAPAVYHYDAREHRSRIIRWRQWHHHVSLARSVVNNLIGHYDHMS